MAIYNKGVVKVRVRGVDTTIRDLVRQKEELRSNAQRGVKEAAGYLMQIMIEKMGSYQSTGGVGGGPWAKLKPDTKFTKMRKYGSSTANTPLVATGNMKNSFGVIGATTTKGIAASVTNTDPKMIYHIYGSPKMGLPPRDVMLITAIEETDMTHDIIMDEVLKGIG